MVIAELLDVCGVEAGLWSYNIDIDPFTPSFLTFDFSLLPVATMVFLQCKPEFNPVLKAIVYSAFSCFIFQPIFVWLGIYNRLQWKDYYSFPFLIIIYLIAYYCSTRETFKKL